MSDFTYLELALSVLLLSSYCLIGVLTKWLKKIRVRELSTLEYNYKLVEGLREARTTLAIIRMEINKYPTEIIVPKDYVENKHEMGKTS